MSTIRKSLAALCLAGAVVPAMADTIVLDFEGIADQTAVGNFYNGGGGTNYGIQFSADTLAIIDQDSGGTGNFGNEPSPNTVMFFLSNDHATLTYAAGFTTGFSFFYSSAEAATVTVYDGLNGTGNVLATLNLSAQFDQNCTGDPNGAYCHWTPVGTSFAGTARSIDFGGTANRVAYDNITFGAALPVPEPSSWLMLAAGLLAAGAWARRKQT